MDGVMIDSERQSNEGWLWAAEQLGVEMPMWLIDSFKGAPNTLSCQFFDNYYHGKIDYWEARKLRTEHIYKIREKEGLPIKKGLFELLDYIRENVRDTIQIDFTIRALTYCVCEHLGEVPDVIEKLNALV